MRTMYMESVCGRTFAKIEIKDAEFNPHGVICCGECDSIIQSRDSWLSDPYVRMYA